MSRFDKLLWYKNRFKSMSLSEILYRIYQNILIFFERFSYKNIEKSVKPKRYKYSKNYRSQKTQFFFQQEQQDKYLKQYRFSFPGNLQSLISICENILAHEIRIFDINFNLGDRIDWARDPVSSKKWPKNFYADIDTRDSTTIGGVKWIWELNRHHHLVTLGKAYFLTKNEEYAQEICSQLQSWIDQNPPGIGVNWTSPLEISIRIINWSWIIHFIIDSSSFEDEIYSKILESIQQQTYHINKHLSAYSSANNHLIGEAAGLAIIGLSFPMLSDAEKWRNKGLKILENEVEKQIYSDGVPAEQAISYLAFVLDFNLLTWRLAELNSFTVPQIWYKRLEAACEFLCHIMDEKGRVPNIGDGDDAWVVRLDDRPNVNKYYSILAMAAVLFDRADFKKAAGQWDEKSNWLLGPSGQEKFKAMPSETVGKKSKVFLEGGYCVMRAPGRVITFDCGPLGYLSIAAHGHADALNITLSVDGQPVLIDPGTYAYQEGGEIRDYFRSTAAHNTVVIGGENQSESLGSFLWGRKATSDLLRWESTKNYDLAIAKHDGYETLGIQHQRILIYHKPDWLFVADYILGDGEHYFNQLWHLSPDSEIVYEQDMNGDLNLLIEMNGTNIHFLPLEVPAFINLRIHKGQEQPLQGWYSSGYGQIETAPVINMSGLANLPFYIWTAFLLNNHPEKNKTNNLREQAQGFWNKYQKIIGD